MQIVHANRSQLPEILAVYADARALQQKHGVKGWPEFPEDYVTTEIDSGRLLRVVDGEVLAGVFSVSYDDEPIWLERERGEHIYLHRIARSDSYSGRGFLGHVLAWASDHCRFLGRSGLRIDTWANNGSLIGLYLRHGFHLVDTRRIGDDHRLPPHYNGLEVTLLEAPVADPRASARRVVRRTKIHCD